MLPVKIYLGAAVDANNTEIIKWLSSFSEIKNKLGLLSIKNVLCKKYY